MASPTRFPERKRCLNFLQRHSKAVFATKSNPLRKLNDLAPLLAQRYPDDILLPDDEFCINCYRHYESLVSLHVPPTDRQKRLENREREKVIVEAKEELEGNHESVESAKATETIRLENHSHSSAKDNSQSSDSFNPYLAEQVQKLNKELFVEKLKVSPLKESSKVDGRLLVGYAERKRKELTESFDVFASKKVCKLYDVRKDAVFPPVFPEPSDCNRCKDWTRCFNTAIASCNTTSEKIKLLTVAPISSLSKNEITAEFPNVTNHMLTKARKVVNEKGIYKSPDIYTGHTISEKTVEKVLEYFLDDDLDCTRQSPNKKDMKTVFLNGEKTQKVKRFMTRSVRETFELFRKNHPDMKISRSKFYSLRPSWVIPAPAKIDCLCSHCANFDLMITALKNYRSNNVSDLSPNTIDGIRQTLQSATVCSYKNNKCMFGECDKCPGEAAITLELLQLSESDECEEITFAFWEKNELIKKTMSVENFFKELSELTVTMNVHLKFKEIQQISIREEKLLAESRPLHLTLHGDFSQNWAVVYRDSIQSNYWKNDQVSLFTSVCYYQKQILNFVVASDDRVHDTAHALLAMDSIRQSIKEKFPNVSIESETIISDGAASHFKNRFQFHEFAKSKKNMNWIYSATGHGKGNCDGLGGSSKHCGTKHNLSKDATDSITDAKSFVEKVSQYTPNITLLHLESSKIADFRSRKKVEWATEAKKIKGIRSYHAWKLDVTEQDNPKVYAAKTKQHEWDLIKLK